MGISYSGEYDEQTCRFRIVSCNQSGQCENGKPMEVIFYRCAESTLEGGHTSRKPEGRTPQSKNQPNNTGRRVTIHATCKSHGLKTESSWIQHPLGNEQIPIPLTWHQLLDHALREAYHTFLVKASWDKARTDTRHIQVKALKSPRGALQCKHTVFTRPDVHILPINNAGRKVELHNQSP